MPVDPFGARLKNLVRKRWGARTNDGNRRDAERLREIKAVVDDLPQHVRKALSEWYVHPRARDAVFTPETFMGSRFVGGRFP